jgi:hypothetical protein
VYAARRIGVDNFAMQVERRADDNVADTTWCALCGCEFHYIERQANRRATHDVVICGACEGMRNDGLDVHRHAELMSSLAQKGVRLQRLPGGFFRILPRAP